MITCAMLGALPAPKDVAHHILPDFQAGLLHEALYVTVHMKYAHQQCAWKTVWRRKLSAHNLMPQHRASICYEPDRRAFMSRSVKTSRVTLGDGVSENEASSRICILERMAR